MAARQARRFGQAERIHAQQVEYQRIRVSDYVSAGPEEVTPEQLATIENLVQGLARLGEYQCLQHKKDCVSALEEAYSIASHYRLTSMAALSSSNLGLAYHQVPDLTDYEEAERWYAISSSLREKTDVQALAKCLHQRAGVAFQQFACARADAWRFWKDTGAASEEYRDAVDRAEKYFNRASAFVDRAIGIVPSNAVDDLARIHHQRGLLYGNAGDIRAARHHYSISISFDEQQGDFFEAARSRKNFAVDLARKGMLDEAIVWARAALDGFEKYGDRAQREIDATREMVELMVQDSRLHRGANE